MKIFLNRYRPTWVLRLTALVVLPVQLITTNGMVYAQTVSQAQTLVAPTPVPFTPPPGPAAPAPIFPAPITAAMAKAPAQFSALASQVCSMHLFPEPLIPDGATTNPIEDHALLSALSSFQKNASAKGLTDLELFTRTYPHSVWTGAVLADLGLYYRQHGYYSRAVAAWEGSWALLKYSTLPTSHVLADRVVSELLTLLDSLGRIERTEPLLNEIHGRPVYGSALALVMYAHGVHWMMKNRPDVSFKCGPYALQSIASYINPKAPLSDIVTNAKSTPKGFSLAQVQGLATQMNLGLQTAQRTSGDQLLTPCVVHWKSGHFAAILARSGRSYLVKDPTFGSHDVVLSSDAINDETDGYFLVPNGALPTGWNAVTQNQAANMFGRGGGPAADQTATKQSDPKIEPCPNCPPPGMPISNVFAALLSLTIQDVPEGYSPPLGPTIAFQVILTQLEASLPAIFTYFNQGPLCVNNWTSYVQTPSGWTFGGALTVNLPGGGQEIYSGPTTNPGVSGYQGYYGPDPESYATLWVTTGGTYERHMPNGSKLIYTQVNGLNTFMSVVDDPQGNAVTLQYTTLTSGSFNGDLQLTSITDPVGQKTTLSYGIAADPLKITKVTDPFGRSASFGYSGSVLLLSTLTDEIGLTSSVNYDANNYISALNTPYGTTSFIQNEAGSNLNGNDSRESGTEQIVTLQETNPIGQQEFFMRRLDGVGVSGDGINNNEHPPSVSGVGYDTSYLCYRNGFHWDRHAIDVMRSATPPTGLPTINLPVQPDLTPFFLADFAKAGAGNTSATAQYAHIYHWMHLDSTDYNMSGTIESEKMPLENRVWYTYPGEQAPNILGTGPNASDNPSVVARVLDNGDTQSDQYTYNTIGNVLVHTGQSITQAGVTGSTQRITTTNYDPTGIDVQSVTQTSGTSQQTLASATFAYPPTAAFPAHCPETTTDASGQVTSYTYNPQGQVTSVKNPKSETTTFAYNGSGGTGTGNYLHTITGPTPPSGGAPVITYGYDTDNRPYSLTDPQQHVTKTTFDNLDRPLTVTRTDGKTMSYTYNRLDPASTTDFNGKTSYYQYNAIQQNIYEWDAQGALTSISYCTCGGIGSYTDPNQHTTSFARDLEGRVTGKTLPDGTSFALTYDKSSRLLTDTDPNGTVTTNTYNDDNSVQQIAYTPGSGVVATPTQSFIYDAVYPRVYSVTTTGGTSTSCLGTTTFNYNAVAGGTTLGQGMLGSTSFAVGTGSGYTLTPSFQFTYDQLGRILTTNIGAANANTATINNYDDLGRVTQKTNALGQFNLAYLGNTSRLQNLAMPNGVTSTLYYADNPTDGSSFNAAVQPLLTDITNAKGSTNISKFDYQYDLDNRISQWTQTLDASPLTNWNYGYDSIGQLTSAVKTSSTNAVLSQYAYSYDPAGNRTSQEINNSSQNTVTKTAYATTNEAGAQSAGGTLLWKGSTNQPLYSVKLNSTMATIDSTGTNFIANVPVTSGANTVTVTAEDTHADINTDNHNVTVAGNTATAPIYDNNGNTTTDSVGNTYTYDAFNNLITETYKSSGATTTYSYYGSSRVKIAESTGSIKQFIMAGGMAAEEWDGATPVITKRFYGQGVITYSGGVGTSYFYTRDHLGSIRELTTSTGTIAARYDYDPYGVTTLVQGTNLADFQYAGMYVHQPSGYYLSATRAYSPNLGRWITRDPIGESGGLNVYAYCGNNPIDRVDPSGLRDPAPTTETAADEPTYFDVISNTVVSASLGVASFAAVTILGTGTASTNDQPTQQTNDYERAKQIAGSSGFAGKNGFCQQYADDVMAKLEKAGLLLDLKPTIISYQGSTDYIWANQGIFANSTISTNGNHVGILILGTVFDNNIPTGVPITEWGTIYENPTGGGLPLDLYQNWANKSGTISINGVKLPYPGKSNLNTFLNSQ